MPHTINIERHKLNQAMYQKLKRYIMSKRRREQEEKAQDAYFKKLKREREERKRQTELDTENLENTRKEILTTRKRIEDLKTRRNELFQRLKQLASEETSLREKQKSETLTYLAAMPTTQFGMESGSVGTATRDHATHNTIPTPSLVHTPMAQTTNTSTPKPSVCNAGTMPMLTISSHLPPGTISDCSSPHRGNQTPIFSVSNIKTTQITPSTSLTPTTGVPKPLISLTNNPNNVAAFAAAIAAHQRPISSSDDVFPNSAAAAAYFNVIASLANSSSLSGSPLGITYPNTSVNLPASFAEVVAALAASSFSTTLAQTQNGNNISNFGLGSRVSPANNDCDLNRDTIPTPQSTPSTATLSYQQNQQHSVSLPKNPSVPSHHTSGVDLTNSNIEAAKLYLAQFAAAAAAAAGTNGGHTSQTNMFSTNQLQKAHQILRSLNVPNNLIPSIVNNNSCDLEISQMASAPTSTTVSASPLLPPAPISYRGSITTGQSAQQIQQQQQQQQQAHQKQTHNLPKYPSQVEYSTNRGSSAQHMDTSHIPPSGFPTNSSLTAQGIRFAAQQLNPNNLMMLNLTSGSPHENLSTLTNVGKSFTNSRQGENALLGSLGVSSAPGHFNPASAGAGISSTNSNLMTSTSVSNPVSSVSLPSGLAPYAAELASLNYLRTATLTAAFQQQQQQHLNKLVLPTNTSTPPHAHGGTSSSNQTSNIPSGRRFF